jgi:hypothetical protein
MLFNSHCASYASYALEHLVAWNVLVRAPLCQAKRYRAGLPQGGRRTDGCRATVLMARRRRAMGGE